MGPVLVSLAVQGWLLARTFTGATPLPVPGGTVLAAALQVLALVGMVVLLWRVLLVARYRPVPNAADDALPGLTVVVPAYNEGRQVFETIRSLAASDYPREKLRIVAVDDGSADDTWRWIVRGRDAFPGLVTAVRCRVNRGKRDALLEGFAKATGEVLVTVDSDSEVLPDTLRAVVSPLVADAKVGAVAGNVRVLNEGTPLARMLDVAFTHAFEFMRASESEVATVSCCPGALTAIRRDLVEAVKAEWAAQTFLGRPANIGEDRALTNLVLRGGFEVRFQSTAIVLTEVPEDLSRLSKMLLRWERSNVRESLALARFVFGRFREGPVWGARVNCAWSLVQLVAGGLLFVPTIVLAVTHAATLPWIAGAALAGALVPAAVFVASRGGARGLWALPWALYSLVALSWITPWSLLTPQQSGWLTRTLPSRAVDAEPAGAEAVDAIG